MKWYDMILNKSCVTLGMYVVPTILEEKMLVHPNYFEDLEFQYC
jgi:hypothetical protein